MWDGTAQEVSRRRDFVEGPASLAGRGQRPRYSVTGRSEICQSLPSNTEMWSVFIGE
jgi:hypothetical protein